MKLHHYTTVKLEKKIQAFWSSRILATLKFKIWWIPECSFISCFLCFCGFFFRILFIKFCVFWLFSLFLLGKFLWLIKYLVNLEKSLLRALTRVDIFIMRIFLDNINLNTFIAIFQWLYYIVKDFFIQRYSAPNIVSFSTALRKRYVWFLTYQLSAILKIIKKDLKKKQNLHLCGMIFLFLLNIIVLSVNFECYDWMIYIFSSEN